MAIRKLILVTCLSSIIFPDVATATESYRSHDGKFEQKIIVQPFEVMESFHSHFMNSLAIFLSQYYKVSVIAEETHMFTTKHISGIQDLQFIQYQASKLLHQPVMMNIKDDGQLPIKIIQHIKTKGEEIMRMRYSDPGLMNTLKGGNYSLLIYNSMDYGTAALCQHIDIPCIQVITSGTGGVHNPYSLELVNSMPYMLTEFTELNSLGKRIVNTMFYLFDHYLRVLYFYPGIANIAKEVGLFKQNDNIDYLKFAAETPHSTFIYTNNAIDCHTDLPASYIRVGGALLSNNQLEKSFQTLMDRSIDGVILIAFGRGATIITQQTVRLMIEVFGKLNHTVLWSAGSQIEAFGNTSDIPSNVYIFKSLPQNALLAHPNMHLFVTHCGQGSTTEAIYHGVPILATPLRMDQKTNAVRLTKQLGMGIEADIHSLTAGELYSKIKHILSTSEYKTNAIMASHAFRQCDRYPELNILNTITDAIHSLPKESSSGARPRHWLRIISIDVLLVFLSFLVFVVACLLKLCSMRRHKT